MIRATEIRQIAARQNIRPDVIEKDYVLSWVIAALNQQEISNKWIFKGGTALKKCYFQEYRFSEDLDYSVINEDDLTEEKLIEIMNSITSWIYSRSGIELLAKRQKVEILHNLNNSLIAQVRLYYKGPVSPSSIQQDPRIKLDLTSGEFLTDKPILSNIYHPYTDEALFNPQTLCYSFSEIFAEKLRAFVERCRPRDIYDIVHCFEDKQANIEEVVFMFKQKCEAKNIKNLNITTIEKQITSAKHAWSEQLAHQIQDLGVFDDFADKSIKIMSHILRLYG